MLQYIYVPQIKKIIVIDYQDKAARPCFLVQAPPIEIDIWHKFSIRIVPTRRQICRFYHTQRVRPMLIYSLLKIGGVAGWPLRGRPIKKGGEPYTNCGGPRAKTIVVGINLNVYYMHGTWTSLFLTRSWWWCRLRYFFFLTSSSHWLLRPLPPVLLPLELQHFGAFEHSLLGEKEDTTVPDSSPTQFRNMREIVHIQAGQCGNQIGAKVGTHTFVLILL